MLKDNFKQLKLDPSLVYLDSANSTLILDQAVEAIIDTYSHYSNVSRGSYDLAEKNTNLLDDARKNIASFIGANQDEIIFNYSATIGINQLGYGLSDNLKEDDIILLSIYEHNSNLLIWQKLAKDKKAKLLFFNPEISLKGQLNSKLKQKDYQKVKIISLTHASNITGKLFNASLLFIEAKSLFKNVFTILDASQSISKIEIDVKELNIDALVFSSHKVYGPSGIGVLYIKKSKQDQVNSFLLGSQILDGLKNKYTYSLKQDISRFEPGSPNLEGVLGLNASLSFIKKHQKEIYDHDKQLVNYFLEKLKQANLLNKLLTFNSTPNKHLEVKQLGIFSLTSSSHPHDVSYFLNKNNIAVRAGKLCSDLFLDDIKKQEGVIRISFGMYTTLSDIDKFIKNYKEILKILEK